MDIVFSVFMLDSGQLTPIQHQLTNITNYTEVYIQVHNKQKVRNEQKCPFVVYKKIKI